MPREPKPNPADTHIGNKLRALRMERKLSQETLGAQLGVSFQQIQKYEKGVNRIGAGRLSDIAKFFKVPESYFFEGVGARRKAISFGDEGLSRVLTDHNGVKMVEAFLSLNDDLRAAVAVFVVKLAGSSG